MWRCCGLTTSGDHSCPLHIQVSSKVATPSCHWDYYYNDLSLSFSSATTRYRTAGEFVIVMGSTYLSSSDGNTLQYYVQEVVVHPNFHISTLNNDIAALFINGYIPWQASLVKALALNTASLPAATQCAVTGWGVTVNVSRYLS